jgi:hypothetical protein
MQTKMLIDGAFIAGEGEPLPVLDPATGETIAQVRRRPTPRSKPPPPPPSAPSTAGPARPPPSAPPACSRSPTPSRPRRTRWPSSKAPMAANRSPPLETTRCR